MRCQAIQPSAPRRSSRTHTADFTEERPSSRFAPQPGVASRAHGQLDQIVSIYDTVRDPSNLTRSYRIRKGPRSGTRIRPRARRRLDENRIKSRYGLPFITFVIPDSALDLVPPRTILRMPAYAEGRMNQADQAILLDSSPPSSAPKTSAEVTCVTSSSALS